MPVADIVAIASLALTLLGLAVSWGVMTTKLEGIRAAHEELRDSHEETRRTYVPMGHFKDTVIPIQDSMKEMQRDLKSILRIVSTRRDRNDD